MARIARSNQPSEASLSRDRIVEESIAILDAAGESGLTFRTLAERLATGPGAIYWHIDNKSELLTAACDAIIAQAIDVALVGLTPPATIRALALGVFDALNAHPWVGTALDRAPGQLPMVRILERIGQQVRVLGVPDEAEWATVAALLNYILGVGGQNAANHRIARDQGVGRSDFLENLAASWLHLDPEKYPFVHSKAGQLHAHDDRADFCAGIDLILDGIEKRRYLKQT